MFAQIAAASIRRFTRCHRHSRDGGMASSDDAGLKSWPLTRWRWLAAVPVLVAALAALLWQRHPAPSEAGTPSAIPAETDEATYANERRRMVEDDLRGRDITDSRVLRAMETVPRHLFVPENLRPLAYADRPWPIGNGQTISQPYIVALMTQLAGPGKEAVALDVGTGSGYQAAVLAETCKRVYSIEIVAPLAKAADRRLKQLGYQNVTVRHGDGYRGWKEHSPFDVIIVAAAPDHIPQPLIDQLAPGGRLVIPVGKFYQDLIVVEKRADGSTQRKNVAPVAFVPMTGEAMADER